MTILTFVSLLSVVSIILVIITAIREAMNGLREMENKKNEEKIAVRKLIKHMTENPNDETFLNKNFSFYCQKRAAKNGTIYRLKLYEYIFSLYWLVYVYRDYDDVLKTVKYCSKDSDAGSKLMSLLRK